MFCSWVRIKIHDLRKGVGFLGEKKKKIGGFDSFI
jgi:hypothetical protein